MTLAATLNSVIDIVLIYQLNLIDLLNTYNIHYHHLYSIYKHIEYCCVSGIFCYS